MAVVAFVVGLLLFLSFDNAAFGQAIYASRFGAFYVSGPASIFINIGIIGLVCSFLSFIMYLFNRSTLFLKGYKFIGAASGVFIFIGIACSQA